MAEVNYALKVIMSQPSFAAKIASKSRAVGYDLGKRITNDVLRSHTLKDYEDIPLPKWATKILCESQLSFKERCRVLLMHHILITSEVVEGGPLKATDLITLPVPQLPKWLQTFKENQQKKAEELAQKYK